MEDRKLEMLLHKRILGELSTAEQEILGNTLKDIDGDVSNEISTIWDVAKDFKPSVSFNSDKAFGSLLDRISAESDSIDRTSSTPNIIATDTLLKKEAKVFNLFSIRNMARIAAVFVFGLVSFITYDSIKYDILTAGDQTTYAMLDDGSSVWLAPGSSIKYNASFANNRSLELTGKAFFDVARDEEHPFEIVADGIDVMVLGTSFTVDEKASLVSVKSGKVSVSKEDDSVLLSKGQKASLQNDKLEVKESNEKEFSWINPILSFDNTPLDQVIKELSVHFNVDISYKGRTDLSKCPFTATNLSGTSLDDVISILKATYSMEVEISKENSKKIIFSRVRCR